VDKYSLSHLKQIGLGETGRESSLVWAVTYVAASLADGAERVVTSRTGTIKRCSLVFDWTSGQRI
jgi:hypothetical protein